MVSSDAELNHWLQKVWEALEFGSSFSRHPFHFPVLTTFNGRQPVGRTVVLRESSQASRQLGIYTDIRSVKVNQIRKFPDVGLVFWDMQEGIQVRVQGTASLRVPTKSIRTIWEQLKPESKLNYRTRLSPGTPVTHYQDAYQEVIPEAMENLGIIDVLITEIDWLKLSVDGHLRAQWLWSDSRFQGTWVVP
ncbi:MAG: pyridoxamine 5'-phosphate oxidase family protein [Bacteroidetes bacterium]|nr:pyridoxamine 5'-phosphate oxidase family protein [Bacteroidota bacterium]